MASSKGYSFLLWNGKYGKGAKFVVKDNASGKQTYFTPDRMKDISWVQADLTKDPSVKSWQDFHNEQIENLDDVVF
jgi:hypothetical protein